MILTLLHMIHTLLPMIHTLLLMIHTLLPMIPTLLPMIHMVLPMIQTLLPMIQTLLPMILTLLPMIPTVPHTMTLLTTTQHMQILTLMANLFPHKYQEKMSSSTHTTATTDIFIMMTNHSMITAKILGTSRHWKPNHTTITITTHLMDMSVTNTRTATLTHLMATQDISTLQEMNIATESTRLQNS